MGSAPAYVITAEQIHRMGFMTVVEALRLVPGVLVRRSEMKSIVSIRGTGDFPYNNRVLFLLDGVPINSPDTGTFPGFPMDHLIPIEEVERVEVYRGPGSTVFGPGAYQGTVNIVSKSGPIGHSRRGLHASGPTSHSHGTGGSGKTSYTCPMCGGDFDAKGSCPKCGMPLVEADRPAQQQGGGGPSYTCPMCGGDFDAMGSCPKCGMPLVEVPGTQGGGGKDTDHFGMGMLHLMGTPEGEPMVTATYGARDGDTDYSLTVSQMTHGGELEVTHDDFEHNIENVWFSVQRGPWSSIFNYMHTDSTPFEFGGVANADDEAAFHAQGGVDMMPHPPRTDVAFHTLGTKEELVNWFGTYDNYLDAQTRVTAQASFQYRRATTCAACHTGIGTTDAFSLSRVPWAGQTELIQNELQETYRAYGSAKIERSICWPFEQNLSVKVETINDGVARNIMVTQNPVDANQSTIGVSILDEIPLLRDDLWLTLGGRWDHLDYVPDEFSCRATLAAHLSDRLDVSLTGRTGFRPPTWDEHFSAFVVLSEIPASVMGTEETGAQIRSERIEALEFNANLQLSPKWLLRFDGYLSRLDNFIDRTAPPAAYRVVPPPMIFTWGNVEEQIDINGFELSLEWVPSHRLWCTLGWAHQETDTPPGPDGFVFGEWPYKGPPYAPKNTFKFQAFTEPLDGVTVNFNAGWFDERFVQSHMYPNPAIYHNWSDADRVAGLPLKSYFLADASIAYRLPVKTAHVQIALLVEDLFDEKPTEYRHHLQDPSNRVGREFMFMLMLMKSF